jgi:hypothetical protein
VIRTLLLLLSILLWLATPAFPQTQPAPETQPPETAPTTETPPPDKPSSTDCTNWDGLFADRLSNTYLLIGGLTTLVLIPLLIPMLFGYRYWWLTRPIVRWLVLATLGWALITALAVLIPQLAPKILWISYSTPPDYVKCADVPVASKGVLWGLFGDRERVVIAQEGAMWLGVIVVTSVGLALYWAAFLTLRQVRGSPAWWRKEN